MDGEKVVGTISSGEWGYRVGKNLAYAFVDMAYCAIGTEMDLDLCGDRVTATVTSACLYDAENIRMRR